MTEMIAGRARALWVFGSSIALSFGCLVGVAEGPSGAAEVAPVKGAADRSAWSTYLDGDRAAARAAFAKAIAASPNDVRSLFGLAALDEEEGRFAVALDESVRVLEARAPATPDPYRQAIAIAATGAVERLSAEVPGQAEVAARLAKIDVAGLEIDVKNRLLAARAVLARRMANETESVRLDEARGCPPMVMTAGPYGHLPHLDLARPFAPDHSTPVVKASDRDGLLIDEVPVRGCAFAVDTPQARPGIAYAIVWVKAPSATTATVGVSIDQPWHLLVDGKVAFRQDGEDRFPPRTRTLSLPLSAGWHRVALKLAAPGSRTPAALRIMTPVPLTWSATEPAGNRTPAKALDPKLVRARIPGVLPDSVRTSEPRLFDYLNSVIALREGDPDTGQAVVARLLQQAPRFVPGLVVAAQIADTDPSRLQRIARDRARRHLERALSLDPACAQARYALADMDVQDEHPDKALARLAAAPPPPSESPTSGPGTAPPPASVDKQPVSGKRAPKPKPKDVTWRLAFARYRALRARGWLVEAEQALADAHDDDPESCAPLQAEVQVAVDRRDLARARKIAEQAVRCGPDSEDLAIVARDSGDTTTSAAEYRRLLAIDPTRAHLRSALGDALAASGDPRGAAEVYRVLVKRDPAVASYRRQLADALLSTGDTDGAKKVLIEGLEWSPESQELEKSLAALGVAPVIDAFRVDGKKVIADFEAAGTRYDSPSVIVLDRTVTRVFGTGARITLTHNIVKVQTKDGIDKWGEVQIPEGADVLLLRTVKADGTTREPEQIAEKQSVSVPDLQPGDYVEFEYVDPSGAPQAFPRGFYAERFYFQSPDAPLDRTEYLLATPKGMPVQVDSRGAAPGVTVEARGELEVRTWSDRKKKQLVPEPQQSPSTEYVPSVRVASGVTYAGWRDFLRDQQFGTRRANVELAALAAELKTVPAIDDWVRKNVKQGGALDEPATVVLARGEGSRVVLARALLNAIGTESRIDLVRPVSGARLDGGPLPDLEGYDEPVLMIAAGKAGKPDKTAMKARVTALDPRFRHAPTGFVAPLLRAAPALSLAPDVAVRFEVVPGSTAPVESSGGAPSTNPDRRQVRLDATLLADGGAEVTVEETLTGWPALEWREGLDRVTEDRVRAEFEQRTLGFYFPGASLTDLSFKNKGDDAQPLVVTYRFHAPRFARVEGKSLVVPAPYPALLGKRYVGVAERTTPLQLAYAAPTSLVANIVLPASTASVAPAPAFVLNPAAAKPAPLPFGVFSQSAVADKTTLRLRASFAMPPSRVAPADYERFRVFAETVDRTESRAATINLR